MFGFKKKAQPVAAPQIHVNYTATIDTAARPDVIDVDTLPSAYSGGSTYQHSSFTGEKFDGGFGATELYDMDYWTLRKRSGQLFRDNLYARGMIRRLITNEINTGLTLDCTPSEELIPGMSEDELTEWSEDTERRHHAYMEDARVCDFLGKNTGYQLERYIRREALIEGDVLCVLKYDKESGQDRLQVVPGSNVVNPPKDNANIENGVETDSAGRHIAYWIEQDDGRILRQSAFGTVSNRRVAWLVYGCDKRYSENRGEPLLSIILQSLKEVDRYRDAAQRKAVINSLVAMYVTKENDKPGSRPLTSAMANRQTAPAKDEASPLRRNNYGSMSAGIVLDELQQGEDIKGFRPDGTDINFAAFESAIVIAIAWANEMPPEILQLQFSNNYSASQAAINEFKMYLNLARSDFSAQLLKPWYKAWLYNEMIARRIVADGLMEAWNDKRQYPLYNAWVSSDWTGAIKPSTDMLKQAKAYGAMVDRGWITNERATKELNGSSFRQNMKRIEREQAQIKKVYPDVDPQNSTI